MPFRIDQLAILNLVTVGNSVTAGSFVRTGGTSSQFLKADGSVDASAYITGITSGMVTTALGYTPVPPTRTLTINGTAFDLSADRSWTISAGVSSVTASGLGITASPTTGAVIISNTGVTSNVAGTGISVSGATGAVTITNTGVTSLTAGTGISVSSSTGGVTVTNSGVTSVNGGTGAVTGIATTTQLASYLPLAGGTMTGVITTPNNTHGIIVGDDSRLADRNIANTLFLEGVQNNDRGYINFGNVTGNALGAINAGSLTWRGNVVLDASNYNTYSPTLTGTGASGTWGISISGNAATVTNGVYTTGSYANPSWITSLAWSKITGTPTTLSGYGITDALSNSTTSTQSGYFGDIFLFDDVTPSHYLAITNSANLTAARTLSVNVNDADRTISLSGNLTVSSAATVSGTNTGDQTITLTGDVTGSGTGSFATTLANSGVTAGTYNNVTVNVKGLVTSGSNVAYLTGNQTITLSGEATGSGSTGISVTLTTSSVTGKLLTGLSITGSAITSSDSILTAFGKLQNQVNGLTGGVTYQGTWNASTNSPTLTSSVGTKGFYYVVSVAGSTNLNGVTDWKIGDWAIYNGTAWEKVDNTDAVSSVNGQTGAVVLSTTNIAEGTNLYYTDARARAALSFTAGSGAYNSTTGVITIPTNTNQLTNGAGFITGNQTITLSGDASGSGATAITVTLANSGVVAGTYNNVTVNAKGLVTTGSNVSYLTGNQTITLSGDATGSGATSISVTLANSGVAAGTYGGNNSIPSLTIDAKGRVTSATTVTPSGTWGISISGNAATATNSTQLNGISSTQIFNNMGQVHGTRTSFDTTPNYDFGFRFVQGSTNGPGTGGSQYYSWYIGLGSDYPATGAGSYGAMFAVDRNVTTPYLSVRYNENNSFSSWRKVAAGYADSAGNSSTTSQTNFTSLTVNSNTVLHAGNYNSYSPTLTGGGASGTWSINITGNADTVDNFHASQSTVANNIVVRDGNGYIFGNYINMTDDGNPGGGTAITSFITKQGDNYYRSVSPTNAMVSIRGVASGSWGINITGSAGSAGSASTASLVNGTSGGAIQTWDIRTIAPNSMSSYRLGFGFTSWNNNNTSPWADYLHLRSYSDSSGGSDNLITFLKSGIGMRIWQQTFGSASAYSSYVDVLHSSNFGSYAVPLRGPSNWNDSTVIDDVIGLMAWKNYGNNHVIFDASQSTAPNGTSVNNTNSQIAWTGSYPTLMGWNGSNTYGVRVDSARISDNTSGNSATTSQTNFSSLTISGAAVATQSWVSSQGYATGGPFLPLSGGTLTGALNAWSGIVSLNRINFTDTSGSQASDPYSVRWISETSTRGAGLSWLEFQLNDDSNEEIRIYGNSCAGYGCGAISDNLYHRFRADGYAWHAGTLQADGDMRAPIFYDSVDTSYYMNLNSASRINSLTTEGRIYSNEWIQFNNFTGLYSPNNGAHFRPNSGSYGPWLVTGTRNGWSGIEFESLSNGNVAMMINPSSNQTGFHNNAYGWQFFWSGGTLYVYKNAYGGGTQATVWDSVNAPRASNGNLMYYQSFTLDANAMDTNSTGFTYAVNAPTVGPIVRFSTGGSYDMWLHGAYSGGGNQFYLRTRNGDNGTLNSWREIITSGNIGSQNVNYASQAGTASFASSAGNTSSISSAVGGTYTWTGIQYFQSNLGGYCGSLSNPPLQAYSTSNNSAFMSFHKGGFYAVNMGLDADSVLRIGGWSAASNRWQLDMSGNMTVAGDVTAYSDARVKENVETVEDALDKVLNLRGVYYNRTDSEDKRRKVGVIAQEILEVIPEVVGQDNDGMYNVSYGNIVGVLIEAIKEQQQQIDELKAKLDGTPQ